MSSVDPLGDRMKQQYENVTRLVLPRRTYTVLRLDGRAFHRVTRGLARPFDTDFAAEMDSLAGKLCAEVAGSVFAYTQSDEISLLLQDFESTGTQPWFGGNIQKIVSVAASFAGANFGRRFTLDGPAAHFDARVFTIADAVEVANYFIWRQRDAVRNSILMAGQAAFGHSACNGLNTGRIQEKLWSEKQINWNDYPDGFKRGRTTVRETYWACTELHDVHDITECAWRTRWQTAAAPHFTCEPDGFLADTIPALPVLGAAAVGT